MKLSYLILGNFSNRTTALMQWAFESKLQDVTVVTVDTGWSNELWNNRLKQVKHYINEQYGYNYITLKSKLNFQELVIDRKAFPSQKYQWCAYFLKGMTINLWLDQNDLDGQMVILLPKISSDEMHNPISKEVIDSSEYYGYRKVWHPLWSHSNDEINSLVQRSGIPAIKTHSQECSPCIHANNHELMNLPSKDIQRLNLLEQSIGKNMFADRFNNVQDKGIESIVELIKTNKDIQKENPTQGCANNWACRL